jgi:hypothetical protein
MSINSHKSHNFQVCQSIINACENSQTQVLSQNNTCLENPNNIPETTSNNRLNASRKIYNFWNIHLFTY